MKYAHTKVWLFGYGHVIGVDLQELSNYIRRYNSQRIYRYSDFWSWLEWETGGEITAKGFDVLWNKGNPLMNKVPHIHERETC